MESTLTNTAVPKSVPADRRRSVRATSQAAGKGFRTRPLHLISARHHHPVRTFGSREDHAARLHCRSGHARTQAESQPRRTHLFDSTLGINLPPQRRKVGYVFQDLALFPHLSVEDNVEYGLSSLDSQERKRRSAAILESFRIRASALATARPDFRWRASESCAGPRPGDRSRDPSARRTAGGAGCRDQVQDRGRPARLEPGASAFQSFMSPTAGTRFLRSANESSCWKTAVSSRRGRRMR